MKTTITLKEFSALPSGAVQVSHASAPDSQPQPTTESVNGFHVPPDRNADNFRELLHRRYTTPFVSAISWGINE